MALLVVRDLKKIYGKEPNQVSALKGIDLLVNQGEFVAIVGTSGSGKSTLFHIISGLDSPSSGTVQISGNSVENMSRNQAAVFRRQNIGFIFQNYNLVPILNVYENIVLPIELDYKQVDQAFINEIINVLQLEEKKFAFPNELSGGQQQRVAIARALATKPYLMMADEPTGNLDKKNRMRVLELLLECKKRFNQTIVLITHDEEVASLADKLYRLEDGKITQSTV